MRTKARQDPIGRQVASDHLSISSSHYQSLLDGPHLSSVSYSTQNAYFYRKRDVDQMCMQVPMPQSDRETWL